MTRCDCDKIASRFDEDYAAEKLALYRSAGPDPSSQALIDLITDEDIEGKTLLDIGGGVGTIQHALLESGASAAQEVEASRAYADASADEAERQGHGDRVTHLFGDFASVADAVKPADIVTLDRSVCCWHDPLDLIDRSASEARWLYGLVYPRDAWWVRHGWRHYGNLKQVVRRSSLRLTTPRERDVETILARHGLHRHRQRQIGVWQIALYEMDSR
jgi:hypothetical protein